MCALPLYLVLAIATMVESNRFYENFYNGDQVLRVRPDTESKVKEILGINKIPGLERLDAWMPTFRANHPADFYAKKTELPIMKKFLENRDIDYSVLVANVTQAILGQRTSRRRRHVRREYDYRHFHPLDEIHKELGKLGHKYSNITQVFSLGKSYEKREMRAIKISARKKSKKNRFFFIECGTHAREWLSPATCMWLIRAILEERRMEDKHGTKGKRMCNKIDWVIIPVLNVDGYVHSWTRTGRFWRKNRRPNNGTNEEKCRGTDLNRNWGYKWGGNGSSNDPCASSYRGPAPFSEIETRNVAKYLYKHRCQLLGYIGLHSYSQFWMTPWGYKTERPEHYPEMKRVADAAVLAIKNSGTGNVYEDPGPSSEIIYQNTGSPKDWTYAVLNVHYSYGVELRPHYNENYGFLIPHDQIKPTGEEIVAAVKAISTVVHLYEGRRLLNPRKSRRIHDHEND